MKKIGNLLPFEIHIAKRSGIPTWKAWMIRGAAILIALLLCAVITIIITKMNPVTVLESMFNGTFSVARKRWITLYRVAILLGISLAVTPAFKMRFWNIGAEGQVLIGAFAAAACMFYAGRMPFFNDPTVSMTVKNLVLFPCMLIAAIGAGALWGFLPAFFKSRWNTNETLFTLMMNYIALQIVKFMIAFRGFPERYLWSANGTSVGNINSGFQSFGIGTFPKFGDKPGTQYLIPIAAVGLLTVVLFLYLRFSKHGYEISVVGESERTASYAGIKVNRVIVRTMVLSGAICGLVGMLLVGGTDHTLTTTLAGGRGFTAVMVSWLAKFNPIGMIFTSFLLVFLQLGAKEIASVFFLNESFADILTGVILFFIIGCEFFINYKIEFLKISKEA
jgi:simple sugar transport system permease protein